MTRHLALALVLALVPAAALADPPANATEAELLFRRANDAYLAGHYDDARNDYWQVVEGGFGTADVYFNLGDAAYESGHLGEAVLAYERALRADPGYDDARANLVIAKKHNVDKLVGGGAGPSFFERVARAVDPGWVSLAFLGAWVLLFAALFLGRLLGRARVILAVLAALGVAGSVAFGGLLGTVAWYRDHVDRGVVMSKVAEVRKGPAPRFQTAFEVHEGLTLRMLDTDGPYVRIRLANGLEGWLLRRKVQKI